MKKPIIVLLLLFVFSLPVAAGETDGPPKAPPCSTCGQTASQSGVSTAIINLVIAILTR